MSKPGLSLGYPAVVRFSEVPFPGAAMSREVVPAEAAAPSVMTAKSWLNDEEKNRSCTYCRSMRACM